MSSIADFLSAHHRDCDEMYASAEAAVAKADWAAADKKATRFAQSLEGHFAMEEEVLFPAFEEATGMAGGPPAVMRAEHAQMRQLLASMQAALAARDATAWLSAGETLLMMIQQHNMKEEGILYPMSDRALGPEAGDIVARMSDVRDRG